MTYTDDFKDGIKDKFEELKRRLKEGGIILCNWCLDNKELLVVIIPIIIFGAKKIDKYIDIHKGNTLRDCSIYDRSLGMYLVSKKPLTTAQKLDIDAMHKAGISYKEIGRQLHIKWK